MATLQVKGLDDALYRALGARAAMENRSVSQEVVTMIQEHLSRSNPDPRAATRAFLDLCGSWGGTKSAKQIASSVRQARRTGKRFKASLDVSA